MPQKIWPHLSSAANCKVEEKNLVAHHVGMAAGASFYMVNQMWGLYLYINIFS